MQLSTGVLYSTLSLHIQYSTPPARMLLQAVCPRQGNAVLQAADADFTLLVQSRPVAAQEPTLLLGSQRAVREWRQHCWPGLLLQRPCSIQGRAGQGTCKIQERAR